MQRKFWFLSMVLLKLSLAGFSQNNDSTKSIHHFGGAVTVTNNGISLIPTFSLGKPAAIFDMSAGKGKLSFEPQLRFSLEGKPWSFLFWWRYKLVTTDKLRVNVGAHPALNFKTMLVSQNVGSTKVMVARRFLAGELSPNYLLAKNITVGMYYLYSHGLDEGTTKNTHFLTLNSNFSNIPLSKQFFLKLAPQLYYLKLDREQGFYFTSSLSLNKKNLPLSLSAIINKPIETDISASKPFVWNASLTYFFNKKYVEK